MAWGYGVAQYATVREIVTVGIGGSAVKVRISNVFGNHPLVIGTATIAVAGTGPAVQPGTLRALRFAGHAGATVPPGHYVYTDPVVIRVGDMERLAVSLYVTRPDLVSVHPCCTTMSPVSYFTPNNGGNLTSSQSGAGLSLESPFPRWVDAVDVLRTSGPGSIVVVGDSITDGYNATVNWTTVLQRRIDTLPPPLQRAVINEGITANALTSDVPTDSQKGGGPSGLARLGGDALSQPGASEIVLFLGTNDLWFGDTAAQLINGYREAIAEVHKARLKVIGVTLLPRSSGVWAWSSVQQSELVQVNQWIRNSHEFDGVLDLAQAVADTYNGACNPNVMLPAYDSGDHLHPNAAGQTAMANAVNPATLGLPPLPRVPPLVAATPTPHCHAALAAS
jgi:lysophospholipase L1-like esterase